MAGSTTVQSGMLGVREPDDPVYLCPFWRCVDENARGQERQTRPIPTKISRSQERTHRVQLRHHHPSRRLIAFPLGSGRGIAPAQNRAEKAARAPRYPLLLVRGGRDTIYMRSEVSRPARVMR